MKQVKSQQSKRGSSNYIPLSSSEKKEIQKRIAAIKKENKKIRTVQKTIPYDEAYPDGIIRTGNVYTKCVQFYDINYRLSSIEDQQLIFNKYCDFLNYFDSSINFQLTFLNIRGSDDDRDIIVIPEQDDEFNEIRTEFLQMLQEQLAKGNNGLVRMKYITFSIEEDSRKRAKNKLTGIESEIVSNFKNMGVYAVGLNGHQRLKLLHKMLNPLSDTPFVFTWDDRVLSGMSTKDFICPLSMKFSKNSFKSGSSYGASFSINILASELSDKVLSDILDIDGNIVFNMYLHSLDQNAASKLVKLKLSNIDKTKIDEQKKAARAGYDGDILPPDLLTYSNELKKLLENLQTRNERLFIVTIVITNYAANKKQLDLMNDKLNRIILQHNCILMPLDYQQDAALVSTLPLCMNRIKIERSITTAAVGVFMPFETREIFMDGDAVYYGLNALSSNMIMADRKKLKNPNGIVVGTPGTGKSFTVKREILNVYLVTLDDIYICDPEGEYFPLVNALNGQVIQISSTSKHHINPMDIALNSKDDDPIGMKSEFLISLCEIIVGGKYGLDSEERSIIDDCVRKIYMDFFNNNPSPEKMPILSDLQNALINSGKKAAERVANSLALYVTGSLNIFNNRTNVDLSNRIVCFDIKNLGNQLRKVGMLIVQDQVWNRVSSNRDEHKSTRYYMDEFHLLLKEAQTAQYSVEIWKRFRKWGGIPTGITQNVKDLLSSAEIENILENSDFICMLNQAHGDREILGQKLNLSPAQLECVTNSSQGEGLIFYGDVILPFVDKFPTDTKMYQLMTTKFGEM